MSEPKPDRPSRKNGRGTNPSGGMRFTRGLFGWVLFIGLAIMLFLLVNQNKQRYQPIDLSAFMDKLEADQIQELIVDGDEIRGKFVREQPIINNAVPVLLFSTPIPPGTSSDWQFLQYLRDNKHGASVKIENNQNVLINILLPLIPWLLIFGFIWFFVFRQLRKGALRNEPMRVVVVGHEPRPGEAVIS